MPDLDKTKTPMSQKDEALFTAGQLAGALPAGLGFSAVLAFVCAFSYQIGKTLPIDSSIISSMSTTDIISNSYIITTLTFVYILSNIIPILYIIGYRSKNGRYPDSSVIVVKKTRAILEKLKTSWLGAYLRNLRYVIYLVVSLVVIASLITKFWILTIYIVATILPMFSLYEVIPVRSVLLKVLISSCYASIFFSLTFGVVSAIKLYGYGDYGYSIYYVNVETPEIAKIVSLGTDYIVIINKHQRVVFISRSKVDRIEKNYVTSIRPIFDILRYLRLREESVDRRNE